MLVSGLLQRNLVKLLLQEGQEHLLGHWQPGKDDDQKIRFLDQVILGSQLPLKLLFYFILSQVCTFCIFWILDIFQDFE